MRTRRVHDLLRSCERRLIARTALLAALAIGPHAYGTAAEMALRPTQHVDQQKLNKAKALASDFRAGKLSKSDAQQYKAALSRVKKQASAAKSLAGGTRTGACQCTAFCQTIVFANGTEYQWAGSGVVSSPSACADAAVQFCGSAYSTWLHHWNCQPIP